MDPIEHPAGQGLLSIQNDIGLLDRQRICDPKCAVGVSCADKWLARRSSLGVDHLAKPLAGIEVEDLALVAHNPLVTEPDGNRTEVAQLRAP